MPKVSVIIPVYGAEKYIERCARSLFEQTLDDIEYLFVNDCTQDASMDILKRVLEDYPHRKHQVTVHDMERNSGPCKVRVWGMQHVSGEYIAHCDSDDWLDRDMYRCMYDAAVSNDSDIVICDYYKAKKSKLRLKKGCGSASKAKLLEELVYKKYSWALWNKIFRRSLYTSDFEFPVGSMGEDMVIVVQSVCLSSRISHVARGLYYYNISPSSVVRTKTESSCLAACNQQKKNTDILLGVLEKCEGLKPGYRAFLEFLTSINMTPLAYRDIKCLKIWRELCPRMNYEFYFNDKIAFRYKFKYFKLLLHCLFKVKFSKE